jgi:hypothetical protein|tara:strand:- start:397 stop:525 length:129 start_codon:yes stop_codon:yes gene_type:complete
MVEAKKNECTSALKEGKPLCKEFKGGKLVYPDLSYSSDNNPD